MTRISSLSEHRIWGVAVDDNKMVRILYTYLKSFSYKPNKIKWLLKSKAYTDDHSPKVEKKILLNSLGSVNDDHH